MQNYGSNSATLTTFLLLFLGERGSEYHLKRVIIGPPAFRGCTMYRWWSNIECWLSSFENFEYFRRFGAVLLRNRDFEVRDSNFKWDNILTSTKNASLIITDVLAIIKGNEQWRTASLCRGWAMLENDFYLICRWRVIPMTSYRFNVHMTALCIDQLWFQFEFAPSLCRKCFANQRTNLDNFFKQLCLRVITLWNYDVILRTKCKVRLQILQTFSFSFK